MKDDNNWIEEVYDELFPHRKRQLTELEQSILDGFRESYRLASEAGVERTAKIDPTAPAWTVNIFGNRGGEVEISLVHKSFPFGAKSWGWVGGGKILISTGSLRTIVYDSLVKFAHELADKLNSEAKS